MTKMRVAEETQSAGVVLSWQKLSALSAISHLKKSTYRMKVVSYSEHVDRDGRFASLVFLIMTGTRQGHSVRHAFTLPVPGTPPVEFGTDVATLTREQIRLAGMLLLQEACTGTYAAELHMTAADYIGKVIDVEVSAQKLITFKSVRP
jgi:hypothetical protein